MHFASRRIPIATALIALGSIHLRGAEEPERHPPQPVIQTRSPQEEQQTFHLPPGYRMEPVLSEPEIKEPVACAFDGNGRMFVAEMRTYMQNIDGNDELTPTSRVSLHWSSKGDGIYDKHTVFADKLVLPRMVLPLGKGQCVIGETNTLDLYLYTDTDGDGVADKKDKWFEGGPRGGNLEHQPNGLIWALDNGIYTTYNAFRLRWTPTGVIKEPAAPNDGQWGIGQDDHGRLFFMNAGGEKGPVSFQIPIVYGAYNPKWQLADGFAEVWPLVGKADVQGGTYRFRPSDKTLNHFTATAGAEIYRGDRLPAELRGDLFFGEPVGRLVRRAKVEVKNGLTTLSNPYQAEKSEFLRSTDPYFRPVNFATAPDGTLYIVDMYRGIIQEGNWVRPGSHLRNMVEQYAFDRVTNYGRIWRLVHDDVKPGPMPIMYAESSQQLVAHLAHPNGWWRDNAQKLLILNQDKSVVPELAQMARSNPNYLARLHALWTLEGLGAVDTALVREALNDDHPQLRSAALRVGESLFKNGDTSIGSDLLALSRDNDPGVVIQALLTAKQLKLPGFEKLVAGMVADPSSPGVKDIGTYLLNPRAQTASAQLSPEERRLVTAGEEIFNTICASCHGADARGLPMAGAGPGVMLAPALAGSKTINGPREGSIYVLLHGLTGDIDGKKYEGLMVPMSTNDDRWIASVLSYVRTNFGNNAGYVTEADIARARTEMSSRTQPWTIDELRAAIPRQIDRKGWKLTASQGSNLLAAIDGDETTRFDTGTSQAPGMWLQVELPEETVVSGLVVDSRKTPNDYPRGYKVALSKDGATWSKAVATGKGKRSFNEILFSPAKARFIRITQTGSAAGAPWSICDLQVLAPPPAAILQAPVQP